MLGKHSECCISIFSDALCAFSSEETSPRRAQRQQSSKL